MQYGKGLLAAALSSLGRTVTAYTINLTLNTKALSTAVSWMRGYEEGGQNRDIKIVIALRLYFVSICQFVVHFGST